MQKFWLSFEYIAKAGEQISKTIAAPADYIGFRTFLKRVRNWLNRLKLKAG